MILSIEHIVKIYNGREILRGVSATVEEGERIGFVGVNGAGKTTLLRLICGLEALDDGAVHITNGKKIGLLRQDSGLESQNTIYEEMRLIFSDLLAMEKRIALLREAMALNGAAAEYARLQTDFEQREGYLIDVKIGKVLNGMGFADKDWQLPVSALSGGEKTRLALAKLLLEEPDLLILDEPTNHLDFQRIMWLEEFLQGYRGAILAVSHDRYFLDRTAQSIWELENGVLNNYRGNYTQYTAQKEARLQTEIKEYEKEQEKIAAMKTYIEKNKARAATAKSARSREKALERMDVKERPYLEQKRAVIRFPYDRDPVKAVLSVAGLDLWVGEENHLLFGNFNLSLQRGEKLGIVGPNGIGKSTLLKALYGAKDSAIHWGDQVRLGYYDQEGANLNPDNTVLEELWQRDVRQTETEVRTALGRVLLRGEAVYKKVRDLSGGERAKLGFAILTLARANVLLLDEPTNHLDLTAREVLEEALAAYEGTVVLVSHDRYFLNRIPTLILSMESEGISLYEGKYDDYLAHRREAKDKALSKVSVKPVSGAYKSKEQKRREAEDRARRSQLEADMEAAETVVKQCEAAMQDPDVQGDYERLHSLCRQLEQEKERYDALLEEWLALED